MTAPEPTAEQLSTAMQLITTNSTHGGEARIDFADAIARALAAAVHAERQKMRALADELDTEAKNYNTEAARDFDRGDQMGGTNLTGQHYATADAARRVREVAG